MSGDHHVRGELWKRMGAGFGTFHFHATADRGFEAGYPSLLKGRKHGYVGIGGVDCGRPTYKAIEQKCLELFTVLWYNIINIINKQANT